MWLAAPLFFPEALHAAENLERQNQKASGEIMVGADSLSGTGGLKNIILFTAKDSVVYNLDKRSMELWGKANVEHVDTIVKAPKIVIDLDTSLLHAYGNGDSSVSPFEPALFTDQQGSINAETMTYNFKTGRGETSGVISSSNGINFTGEHVSRLENGDLIIKDGTFTTCNEEDPHFWFSSSRMTINSGAGVIASPLIMYIRPEIFSLRLPALPILALPYMVFPVKTGRSSGFLIPHLSSHDESRFLSNFGYFWAINDYSDFRVEGDIALNGSWRLGERFRYTKRNAFSGEIAGEYKQYPLFTDWNAKIVHNQVFDPSTRIDANLQFQGAPQGYNLNSVNSETIVTQQSNARASLAKTFNDENSIAALFYDRSEELSTLDLSQSVGASFYQNRMYPFRSAFPVDDWRSNVSMTTGANFVSQFSSQNAETSTGYSATINGELGYYHQFTPGSKALFTQGFSLQEREPDSGLLDDTYRGTSIMLPLRMQSTLFRYLNFNPSMTFVHSLHPDGGYDNFSTTILAVDASTRLYGVVETGFLDNVLGLKALRHTFIPTITYAWNPSFSGSGYDSYHHLYDWPYQRSINGAVPEGQSTIGLTLKNLFHGKFRGFSSPLEDDVTSGDHSKQLFSLTVSTGYNLAAEALHFMPLTLMASSNVFSENVLFNAGSMYDFYSFDPLTGARVNRFNSEDRNGLLRFVKGFLDMSLSVRGGKKSASTESSSRSPLLMNTLQTFFNMGDFRSIDYNLPWELRFSLFLQEDRSNPLDSEKISLINAAAKASLSKNWQIAMNTGYDLQNGELVLPRLQIYRNLHCWQMSVQWVPFGQFQSYAFEIGLKAPE
jgi:lipopolysaccharide assembly outer membrane protein LptD (OstA)